jgi:hypothetical protein
MGNDRYALTENEDYEPESNQQVLNASKNYIKLQT